MKRAWLRPRRSGRAQRWALAIVIATIAGAAWWAHSTYLDIVGYPSRAMTATEAVDFEVERGATFSDVLQTLIDRGVLSSDESVYFRVFVLHEGAAGKITAGPHRFEPGMTPAALLEELVRRQPARDTQVTIPEGRNMLEIAAVLAEAGLGSAADLERAMRDPTLLAELGIAGESVEGYLFPDTYKFALKSTPAEVIRRMVGHHREVYGDLLRRHRPERDRLAQQLDWGDREIVTLASIVEKETGAKHERPLIAGVFLNRLRFSSFQPKRLETDPTIVYGCTVPIERSEACRKFEGRIRRIHLDDPDNPYNTYTHEGLPPGPIANPGRAALEAVFAPKKSRFLYFVARNDGTHQFSKNVADHERAVELFQRRGAVGDGSAAGAVDP